MDRRFLAVEEGKHQEWLAEGWCQDGLEEGQVGQVLLAAKQLLCKICDTHLKHKNVNPGLDSCGFSI